MYVSDMGMVGSLTGAKTAWTAIYLFPHGLSQTVDLLVRWFSQVPIPWW